MEVCVRCRVLGCVEMRIRGRKWSWVCVVELWCGVVVFCGGIGVVVSCCCGVVVALCCGGVVVV